jgi:hypothetical protein
MKALLSYLVNKGLRRGLLGGETTWLVLGSGALVVQLALRAVRKKPEVVFIEKLPLGEQLIITHHSRTGHNGRRESPAAQP